MILRLLAKYKGFTIQLLLLAVTSYYFFYYCYRLIFHPDPLPSNPLKFSDPSPPVVEEDYYIYDFDAFDIKPKWSSYPKPKIIIKVLTYERFDSLKRSLESLADAYYDGDRLDIDIFFDHFVVDPNALMVVSETFQMDTNINSSEDIQKTNVTYHKTLPKGQVLLSDAHKTLFYVQNVFNWPHGTKKIHYRTRNSGLQAQWIESWWPSSLDEFVFVVEDDVVVSKWWYRYIKRAIQVYYYDDNARDDNVFGISTQKQSLSVGRDERGVACLVAVYNHFRPFLFSTVGTWGQLLFPKHWIQFRLWYDTVKSDPSYSPAIPGVGKSQLRTTSWYNSLGNKIWTPWFIKFLEKKKWYGMYINFPTKKFLSTSYQEIGTSYKRKQGPNSGLVEKEDEIRWVFPPANQLQAFDGCFSRQALGRLFEYSSDPAVFQKYKFHKFIWDFAFLFRFVIFVYGADDPFAIPVYLNWICAAEANSINRYIFVTGNEKVASVLLKRKIAVVLVPRMEQYKVEDGAHYTYYGEDPRLIEAYTDHLKDHEYYLKNHHHEAVQMGQKRLKESKSYYSEISKALDSLIEVSLQYGFNVVTSHVQVIVKNDPFSGIFEREMAQKVNTDIFIVKSYYERYQTNMEPKDKEKVNDFDYKEWMVIKCTKRTQKVFHHGAKLAKNKILSSSLTNEIIKLGIGKKSPEWHNEEYKVFVDSIKALRIKVLSSKAVHTLSDNYFRVKNQKSGPLESALIVLPDVKCCLNEIVLKTNNRSALWTSIEDYFKILEISEVLEVDKKDVMCRRKGCYGQTYRWDLEKRAREFDAGQS